MVDWQVRFVLVGFLLPSLQRVRKVSDRLLLKQAEKVEISNALVETNEAYIKVTLPEDSHENTIELAEQYLMIFLQLYTLTSGHRVGIYKRGSAARLDEGVELGEAKFGDVETKGMSMLSPEGEKQLRKSLEDTEWKLDKISHDIFNEKTSYLRIALSYYYMGSRSMSLEDALVNFTIAAEALFSHGEPGLSFRLSNRIANLIADSNQERIEVFDNMSALYRKRSGIVHGGGKRVTVNDVRTLANYVRKAIERTLLLRDLEKEQLTRKLDEASLSEDVRKELVQLIDDKYKKEQEGRTPRLRCVYRPPEMREGKLFHGPWITTFNDGPGRAIDAKLEVVTHAGKYDYELRDIVPNGWSRIPVSNTNPFKIKKDGEKIRVTIRCKDLMNIGYEWKQELDTSPISDGVWDAMSNQGLK